MEKPSKQTTLPLTQPTTEQKPKNRPKETPLLKDPPPPKQAEPVSGADYKAHYEKYHELATQAAADLKVWTDAQDVQKAKKKLYDASVEKLIVHGAGPPEMPLFEDKPKPPAEDWRAIPLSSIGIKAKTVNALAEKNGGIATVGSLVDFQAKHGTFWVKNLKGVGVQAGTEIDNALEKVWKANPQAGDEAELDIICTARRIKALTAITGAKAPVLQKALKSGLTPAWREMAVSDKIESLKTLQKVEG